MLRVTKQRVLFITNDLDLSFHLKIAANYEIGFHIVEVVNWPRIYQNVIKVVTKSMPHIVVLDISGDLKTKVRNTIRTIKKIAPCCQLVTYSDSAEPEYVFMCFKAGASGYIIKRDGAYGNLIERLRIVCDGGVAMSSEISRIVVESFWLKRSVLSDRESEVFRLWSAGRSYNGISMDLLIAKETAKTHVRNIYKKLGVRNKAEAIKVGLGRKIINGYN
jgi:DNA-binding NarL/FixJ family response regulator